MLTLLNLYDENNKELNDSSELFKMLSKCTRCMY